jgi:hypothetical protein
MRREEHRTTMLAACGRRHLITHIRRSQKLFRHPTNSGNPFESLEPDWDF